MTCLGRLLLLMVCLLLSKEGIAQGDKDLLNSRLYFGLDGGTAFFSTDDIQKLKNVSVENQRVYFADVHFGYQWAQGYALEWGIEDLVRFIPDRHSPTGNTESGFLSDEYDFYAEPLYRFQLNRWVAFLGGIKLGGAAVQADEPEANLGYVVVPDLRCQCVLWGWCGISAGAEYHIANFNIDNSEIANQLSSWQLDDSGPAYRLQMDFYFGRLSKGT